MNDLVVFWHQLFSFKVLLRSTSDGSKNRFIFVITIAKTYLSDIPAYPARLPFSSLKRKQGSIAKGIALRNW